jgi:WD40 repeat protein
MITRSFICCSLMVACFLLSLSLSVRATAQESKASEQKNRRLGIRALAFSPDGTALAASTGEPNEAGEAILWDLKTRKVRWVHKEKTGIPSVAFSPDGKTLAVGTYDTVGKLLEVESGKIRATLQGHTKAVRGVTFSPDGKTLATGSWDRTIKFWDPANGAEKATLSGHQERIYMVAFSPNGNWLASAGMDREGRVWEVASGKTIHTFQHGGMVVRYSLFAGNDWVVTVGYEGTARVWNLQSGKLRLMFRNMGGLDGAAFSPDFGLLAVCGGSDKKINLFKLPLMEPREDDLNRIHGLIAKLDDEKYEVREAAGKALLEIGITSEPDLFKAAHESNSAEVRIRARRLRLEMQSQPSGVLKGHLQPVEFVAFSPDGKTLASGSKDGVIKLWDMRTLLELSQLNSSDTP